MKPSAIRRMVYAIARMVGKETTAVYVLVQRVNTVRIVQTRVNVIWSIQSYATQRLENVYVKLVGVVHYVIVLVRS